jgi:hypothetical protein
MLDTRHKTYFAVTREVTIWKIANPFRAEWQSLIGTNNLTIQQFNIFSVDCGLWTVDLKNKKRGLAGPFFYFFKDYFLMASAFLFMASASLVLPRAR